MSKKLILGGLALFLASLGPARGELYLNFDNDEELDEVNSGVTLGIGYTYSDDLSDMIDEGDRFDRNDDCDDDGDWGWVDVNVGIEIPVNLHIAVNPYLALYFNNADDDYLNAMLVPTFAVKILWETDGSLTDYQYPYAGYFPYVQLEANYNFPIDGGDADFGDGGVGGAILIGHQLPYNIDLGIGASYIPVDFDDDCHNMGGFVVRLTRTFW